MRRAARPRWAAKVQMKRLRPKPRPRGGGHRRRGRQGPRRGAFWRTEPGGWKRAATLPGGSRFCSRACSRTSFPRHLFRRSLFPMARRTLQRIVRQTVRRSDRRQPKAAKPGCRPSQTPCTSNSNSSRPSSGSLSRALPTPPPPRRKRVAGRAAVPSAPPGRTGAPPTARARAPATRAGRRAAGTRPPRPSRPATKFGPTRRVTSTKTSRRWGHWRTGRATCPQVPQRTPPHPAPAAWARRM
mmetsp:Transcript_47905/g.108731  ORF Transcript_47905/g.108731 Transcript_47905/m.108731 type:complete len:242 (+) Transcript_47905:527-1252(+)